MNILFHISTALGLAVVLTDTRRLPPESPFLRTIPTAAAAFVVGMISHGALDYIPHRYPVNPLLDVILGALLIPLAAFFTHPTYRPIVLLACLGSILPDLVDLAPELANQNLGLTWFPDPPGHLFPWHWNVHSGSLYHGHAGISAMNHTLLLIALAFIGYFRRVDLFRMIRSSLFYPDRKQV